VEFYKAAFGAVEIYRVESEAGDVVSQLSMAGAEFWVAEESPEHLNFSPESVGGGTVRMLLQVDDPDGAVRQAVAAGATEVRPVQVEHGWRLGRIADPFGHHWEVGTPLGPWPPRTPHERRAEPMYHDGHRTLQDRFDSRRIADRLEQVTVHANLSDGDVAFIQGSAMFFLATADAEGLPDVSYKGGRPGFVRCLDRQTIAFPSYDGNGMFRSLGNVLVNDRVALLFVNFERPDRLRVHGLASVAEDDPLRPTWEGAQAVVRVRVVRAFPNCPRYIHRMALQDLSVYAPAPGHQPPTPEWKAMEEFRDYLPGQPPP
jgi:uncharacterized glyoxalase superfamily protein PhnB/predicted pyridoxine 5'-phosphate oxidase superfamily flavin-nucleotide-binding protein